MLKKEFFCRLVFLLIGLIIAHFGVTLFLQANLGSDAYNILVQGILKSMRTATRSNSFTHGFFHICLSFVFMILLLIIDKSYIKFGTIICMFSGGMIIDICTICIRNIINDSTPYCWRIFFVCLGSVILAFGLSIVIKSEAGTGPNDLISIVISDKTKKNFGIIRIIVDICFIIIGFFLGGTVGVGTVLCALLVGPVTNFFLPFSEKNIINFIKR